jgi:hypothetical protein
MIIQSVNNDLEDSDDNFDKYSKDLNNSLSMIKFMTKKREYRFTIYTWHVLYDQQRSFEL